jgi:hypothetical protein
MWLIRKHPITVVALGLLATILLLVLWLTKSVLYSEVRVSYNYGFEARFTTLPPDDDALVQWIKQQPGVVSSGVGVIVLRSGNDAKTIRVTFTQVRNLNGIPPTPDLDTACASLGYGPMETPFHSYYDD